MPIQDHPCYVTPEEWERFAALTGSSERHIAWLREQLEAQIANCYLDLFPSDEHRAAWRRGYVDAVLNFGCPPAPAHTAPCPDPYPASALADIDPRGRS